MVCGEVLGWLSAIFSGTWSFKDLNERYHRTLISLSHKTIRIHKVLWTCSKYVKIIFGTHLFRPWNLTSPPCLKSLQANGALLLLFALVWKLSKTSVVHSNRFVLDRKKKKKKKNSCWTRCINKILDTNNKESTQLQEFNKQMATKRQEEILGLQTEGKASISSSVKWQLRSHISLANQWQMGCATRIPFEKHVSFVEFTDVYICMTMTIHSCTVVICHWT